LTPHIAIAEAIHHQKILTDDEIVHNATKDDDEKKEDDDTLPSSKISASEFTKLLNTQWTEDKFKTAKN